MTTLPGINVVPDGRGSENTTLLTGSIPLFIMAIVYGIISPMTASVTVVLFTTLTLGEDTDIVTVFDVAERLKMRPSGSVKLKAAVPVLDKTCGFGSVSITTEKETGIVAPGCTEPRSMPVEDLLPERALFQRIRCLVERRFRLESYR